MLNWVDAVVVTILIYNIFRGIRIGFIKSVLGIMSYIVAGIIAKVYYFKVLEYLMTNFSVFKDLQTTIRTSLLSRLNSSGLNLDMTNIDLSSIDPSKLNELNLPSNIKEQLMNAISKMNINSSSGSLSTVISDKLSSFVMGVIAFLLVFIVAYIALILIVKLLDSIAKLPILKEINKLGGFIVGVVKGLVFIYIIMTIIMIVNPIVSNSYIVGLIQSSMIGSFFYNHNIIMFFVKNMIASNFSGVL
ncbi:CvpA family protein [Helicovermis profundi]|uniref:Colicin V production protein n=1 Tax=Helicovermis profundi TaxID=3065157 RepID=A0AAU9EA64_9FIRM|nr:hypothetical protein HLPR_27490 [Clostridia bacterium S502]